MTRHSPPARRHIAPQWLALGLVLSGCGMYHPASDQALYPSEWHSVAVPIAENTTFWPDIERQLTEAVLKEVAVRTPYALQDRSRAQTLLQLKVTQVNQRVLSRRSSGLPQELEMTVVVDMDWIDTLTGKTIRSRHGLQGPGRYVPSQGVQESNAIASREAVERLARDIVDAMRNDW